MSVSPADLQGPYVTVFDVGAFRGDFARACMAEWPDCTVHSFEPLAVPAVDLSERWAWHAVALGSVAGATTMHRNVFLPSSSILEMAELHETAFPYTHGSEPEQVIVGTVAQYADVVVTPALLKIDVQGYELEVLRGAGEYLGLFDAVVLEVSHELLYHGAPTAEELSAFLAEAGFVMHSTVDRLTHPRIPRLLLQSDELWVRA